MAVFYVETVRLPFGGPKACVKVDFNVHKEANFSRDALSRDMTSVFRVEHVRNSTEAVACIIERLAGKSTCVSQVF